MHVGSSNQKSKTKAMFFPSTLTQAGDNLKPSYPTLPQMKAGAASI